MYILQEVTTTPRDIDVDELIDKEVPCPDLYISLYLETRGLNKDKELLYRLPKSTAPLLRA
jgi:hypothetical protein